MTFPLIGCAPSSQSASCGEVRADLEERPPEVSEGVPAKPARGWDQAVFRCGQCGIKRSAATEDDYLKTVVATRDAYAVWDRLDAFLAARLPDTGRLAGSRRTARGPW